MSGAIFGRGGSVGAMTLLVLSAAFVPVARADEAAEAVRRQVVAAYKQTDTYHARITFSVSRWSGRWRLIQVFEVAWDRSGDKLRMSRPDLLVVGDGRRLYARSEMIPDRYLEVSQPAPLTYRGLLEAAPFLAAPPLPGVMLMLGHDPMAAGERLRLLEADPADAAGRRQLVFRAPEGDITYLVDPKRHLVTAVRWRQGDSGQSGWRGVAQLAMDIEILRHNQPLDAGLFAFDGRGAQAVGSIAELTGQPAPGPQHPAPASAPAPAPAATGLVGQSAPAIRLNDLEGRPFVLDKVKAEVIVLDFWATWCPPCVQWLPRIDELNRWAQRGNKSVVVVAVNLQEDRGKVKRFWDNSTLTIPTLLDTSGSVAEAYGVEGIPMTVVISGGKVRHVHVGGGPHVATELKAQIETLLRNAN